jgi:hypothetical protein
MSCSVTPTTIIFVLLVVVRIHFIKMMLSLALATLLLASVQAKTPDNVSSRLMIHVSHPFVCDKQSRVGNDNGVM